MFALLEQSGLGPSALWVGEPVPECVCVRPGRDKAAIPRFMHLVYARDKFTLYVIC